MKSIVISRFKNEAYRLESFLDHCGRISDGVILMDDHSDDDEGFEIAKKHPAVIHVFKSFVIPKDVGTESIDFVSLLSVLSYFKPDVVIGLDCDERIEEERYLKYKDELLNAHIISIGLPIVEANKDLTKFIYNDPIWKKDCIFQKYNNIIGCWHNVPIHARPVTTNYEADTVWYANIRLFHQDHCSKLSTTIKKWQVRIPAEMQLSKITNGRYDECVISRKNEIARLRDLMKLHGDIEEDVASNRYENAQDIVVDKETPLKFYKDIQQVKYFAPKSSV